VDTVRSKKEAIISGVPQGTVLGPLMFLFYINDMPGHLHAETCCRLFADDTLLYRVVPTIADQVQLQQDLNKNLAIANRSRVSCPHNTSRAFIGLITRDLEI